MKHIFNIMIWLAVATALPAMAQVSHTVQFAADSLTGSEVTVGGETFMLYSLPDCDHIDQTGAPMLPLRYMRLSVPYNATNITVTAQAGGTPTLSKRRVYPVPEPIPTDGSVIGDPELVIDSAIYMTDALWPESAARLVGDGFYMGENRIVTVAVFPMRCNPVAHTIATCPQVQFTVNYDLGDTPSGMLVRRGGDLRQHEQQSVKEFVVNPAQVEQFAMSTAQIQHMSTSGLVNDSVAIDTLAGYGGELQQAWGDRARYLIVTTRELAPSFKRLAALKRQKGYSVKIKCIEDILADPRVQQGDKNMIYPGAYRYINDDAGKLRQYLKLSHAFDNTQFVLLGGMDVPYRCSMTIVQDTMGNEIRRDSLPTDWYYADLTSSWRISNGYNPEYIYYSGGYDAHELLTGRLMATKPAQIDNYTEKLLRYELNPGNGHPEYLTRNFIAEGAEFSPYISFGKVMADAYKQTFKDNTLIIQKNKTYPKGKDVVDSINTRQYGLLSIMGHGSPYSISVNNWYYTNTNGNMRHYSYYDISSLDKYTQELYDGLDCLKNKYSPGVFYSWSCDNAPFDNFQRSFWESYDFNMAQSYVLGKDYGGVAFLGNTRVGYFIESMTEDDLSLSPLLEKQFAQLLSQGKCRISEAEALSKQVLGGMWSPGKNHLVLTHNLHGDPEFEIWTATPEQFNNISVTRNDKSITVSGDESFITSIVSICSDTSLMKKVTDTSVVFNKVNPNSTVMVYRHNRLPWIAPLVLQNERIERSQYVIADDVVAGRAVDENRTAGDLVIAAGSEYEIDAKGTVTLAPGFKVEKGAYFSVTKSDY